MPHLRGEKYDSASWLISRKRNAPAQPALLQTAALFSKISFNVNRSELSWRRTALVTTGFPCSRAPSIRWITASRERWVLPSSIVSNW